MSYIIFDNIVKKFNGNTVLKGVSFSVEQGDFVTLLGPSGCGKSTLLRCLAGLESVSGGKIFLEGRDITDLEPKKRDIGMVFQHYSLFPNMNVFENISFGLKMKGLSKEEISVKVASVIDMVDLRGKEKSMPSKLSGGQQQRVALARSIVTEPKVLLLDEPLSAIDAKLRRSLQKEIRKIQKDLGITTIFVTHDQDEALMMSDVIHLFHDGRIEQSGKPIELYTSPRTRFAAEFIGNYNLLEPETFAALTGTQGSEAIAIRPEAIDIVTEPPAQDDQLYVLPAVAESYIPHGNVLRYTLYVGEVKLHADVLFRSFKVFRAHQPVFLVVEKRNCLPVGDSPSA